MYTQTSMSPIPTFITTLYCNTLVFSYIFALSLSLAHPFLCSSTPNLLVLHFPSLVIFLLMHLSRHSSTHALSWVLSSGAPHLSPDLKLMFIICSISPQSIPLPSIYDILWVTIHFHSIMTHMLRRVVLFHP